MTHKTVFRNKFFFQKPWRKQLFEGLNLRLVQSVCVCVCCKRTEIITNLDSKRLISNIHVILCVPKRGKWQIWRRWIKTEKKHYARNSWLNDALRFLMGWLRIYGVMSYNLHLNNNIFFQKVVKLKQSIACIQIVRTTMMHTTNRIQLTSLWEPPSATQTCTLLHLPEKQTRIL